MEQIKALIIKYLRGVITPQEKITLDNWLSASDANRDLFAELNNPDLVAESLGKLDRLHQAEVWDRLSAYSKKQQDEPSPSVHRVHFLRRHWAAAAVILILAGTVLYLGLNRSSHDKNYIAGQQEVVKDIPPGRAGAILTLNGGKTIVLDSAATGTIGMQGKTLVDNKNGQLTYKASTDRPSETIYNTLTTPRGNQYQLLLPDGTRAWLNAASSITYPTAFAGAERKVSITGEAYFEVAANQHSPFVVQNGGLTVQVLGTHFNINTYQDERTWKTTLLEGRIKVNSLILEPGQQAISATGSGVIKRNAEPDLEEVMAWKNGQFKMNNTDVVALLRQVARWYDVDVSFKGDLPKGTISGEFPRTLNLSEVIKVLALSGVRCTLEGKKLMVAE